MAAALFPDRQYAEIHRTIFEGLATADRIEFDVVAEFHASSDKHLFQDSPQERTAWEILKNRSIHQFNYRFDISSKYIVEAEARQRISQKHSDPAPWLGTNERLLFRDIARNDDSRTLICCLAPGRIVSSYDTPMVVPRGFAADEVGEIIPFICGLFNSFVYDFLIRPYVDKHIKGYVLKRLIVPSLGFQDERTRRVVQLCRSLNTIFSEVRPRGADLVGALRLRAELDAHVAHLLSVKRDELIYIMSSFPIIANEEVASYGEFLTERLVLERYDMLADDTSLGAN